MKKVLGTILVTFFLSHSAGAGEIYTNRCTNKLINLLYERQSGQKALDIIEFKFTAGPSEILAEQNLTIPPIPLKKVHKHVKNFYRIPEVAQWIRKGFDRIIHSGSLPDKEIAKLMEKNMMYTFVLQEDKITLAKTRSLAPDAEAPGKIMDYGSKHSVLTDQSKPVKMAGEAWVDENGVFHFDNNSGTFKPNREQVEKVERFFREHLGIENVQGHMWTPPS